MTDLNGCLSKQSGWVLEAAYAINSHRQIVGIGPHRSSHYRAFLLTPIGYKTATGDNTK